MELASLRSLDLSHNQLAEVPRLGAGAGMLETLDISHNRISRITGGQHRTKWHISRIKLSIKLKTQVK